MTHGNRLGNDPFDIPITGAVTVHAATGGVALHDTLLPFHNILVRVVAVQWRDGAIDRVNARPALLVPPLVTPPDLLLLARRRKYQLFEHERLPHIEQLLLAAHRRRKHGHIFVRIGVIHRRRTVDGYYVATGCCRPTVILLASWFEGIWAKENNRRENK